MGTMNPFEDKGQYLLMRPTQVYSLKLYKQSLQEALSLCEQHGLTKILADVRELQDSIPVLDRFELGIEMAKILGGKIQLAILARPAFIDRMGENAAVNRGGRVFATSDLQEALNWLEVQE